MKNAKYYCLLFVVCLLSGVLFSLSYSKESGTINNIEIKEVNIDNIKTIYSQGNVFAVESELTNELSIVNKNDTEIEYNIILKPLTKTDDIYIQIDDNEKDKYDDEIIYSGELSSFGKDGDYTNHTIKIDAPKNTKFQLSVEKSTVNYLRNIIKKEENVYREENNYHYFGNNPSNYIKYDDKIYRIIGIIDNEIKIIGNPTTISLFNSEEAYLTINDYLKSINVEGVTLSNFSEYATWLNRDERFWMVSASNIPCVYSKDMGITQAYQYSYYYNRPIVKLSIKTSIIAGDGTLENPYEVSYES